MTFLVFSEHPADAAIIEVGLGGRFDATNVLERPACHRDHARIARPRGVPRRPRRADRRREGRHHQARPAGGDRRPGRRGRTEVLIAARGGCELPRLSSTGRISSPSRSAAGMVYQDEDGLLDLPPPRLFGRPSVRQRRRGDRRAHGAGLELAAARRRGRALPLSTGPARMQRLTKGPLVELAPHGAEIWLDGGHNPRAGAASPRRMADWRTASAAAVPDRPACSTPRTRPAISAPSRPGPPRLHRAVASSDAGRDPGRARGARRRGRAVAPSR